MTWRYDTARFLGDKANPKTGDEVQVRLVDPDTIIGEDEEGNPVLDSKVLAYGYDQADGLTKARFVSTIRREVKATIAHLNKALAESDVTTEFTPTA